MKYHLTLEFENHEEIAFSIYADSPYLAIKFIFDKVYINFGPIKNIICLLDEEV